MRQGPGLKPQTFRAAIQHANEYNTALLHLQLAKAIQNYKTRRGDVTLNIFFLPLTTLWKMVPS